MGSGAVKARQKRRKNQTGIWMAATGTIIIVLVALSVAYLLGPVGKSNNSTPTPAPSGLQQLAKHYITVVHNLNSNETKTAVATQLNGHYNQTELFGWEHTKMVFNQSAAGYFENPIQILSDGKGVCFQWSIVYASACLSENYPCRLVAAVDTTSWSAIHMWTEVYYNGTWVHVDPSDSVWNNPQRYHDPSWGWGQLIGSQVRIYAFQDNNYQDVTATYAVH